MRSKGVDSRLNAYIKAWSEYAKLDALTEHDYASLKANIDKVLDLHSIANRDSQRKDILDLHEQMTKALKRYDSSKQPTDLAFTFNLQSE